MFVCIFKKDNFLYGHTYGGVRCLIDLTTGLATNLPLDIWSVT